MSSPFKAEADTFYKRMWAPFKDIFYQTLDFF